MRRAREFETRTQIYLLGIVLLEICCVAVSTPDPALEPGAFRTLSQVYPDSSLLEQALHAQSKAHVTRDAQLAGHERHLAVQLAAQHVEVVLRSHRDSNAR